MSRARAERTAWKNLWRVPGADVCDRWKGPGGFDRFVADVGPKPSETHVLAKLDATKAAAPGNLAWLSPDEYARLPRDGRGNHRHGYAKTPTWNSWQRMQRRCYYEGDVNYCIYGARGIRVCDRWLGRDGFQNFLADMGERPAGMTLDRANVDGNYEPTNCRWATASQQVRNRRTTKLEEHEPDQIRWLLSLDYTQTEIARFFGISHRMVGLIGCGKSWRKGNHEQPR